MSEYQRDFCDGDNDPRPSSMSDFHGTAVMGVIGMEKNNGICGVGVAYSSSLTGSYVSF